MGDIFSLMEGVEKSTGNATRESGEDITWSDVNYDQLKSLRESTPGITSWSVSERNNNDSILVNDNNSNSGKGGIFGSVHPSTSQVRESLITAPPSGQYKIDPYTGFSDAFMSQEIRQQPSSSETSASPISQPLPSSSSSGFDGQNTDWGNVAYPDSEENDKKNNNVGQIL